jgi:hypothetical protein
MTELALSARDLRALRASARLLDSSRTARAAERIYARFSALPGSQPFLYDLPARIRSTHIFLDFLIASVTSPDFDAPRVERTFAAIGAAHARARLPLPLLDEGPQIFVSCLAGIALSNSRQRWLPEHTHAWLKLFRTGLRIQHRAYQPASRQI